MRKQSDALSSIRALVKDLDSSKKSYDGTISKPLDGQYFNNSDYT